MEPTWLASHCEPGNALARLGLVQVWRAIQDEKSVRQEKLGLVVIVGRRRAFQTLFESQREHRIDAHCTARRDVACGHGHNNQKHRDAGERKWIMRADAEELIGHHSSASNKVKRYSIK